VRAKTSQTVWLFDLDNTLHNASGGAFQGINSAMTAYIQRELEVDEPEANRLRAHYWQRYGATLLGLVHHHGVSAAHFLHHTHALPGLEAQLSRHAHDAAALRRLPGRKFVLTNAPLAYAQRVLAALGLAGLFEGVIAIEHMAMFGQLRPKPDARMFRALLARLQVRPRQCVLVEDTLAHQKTAHALGLRTVWMQRWLQHPAHGPVNSQGHSPKTGAFLGRKPAYVCARIRSLQQLRSLP
jgi:putative hydrolase of the HAD superfamily